MDVRFLRYFIAVAEQLHFTRAAASLGISTPALTVQIQKLEDELQLRLLNRSTKRAVSLTAAGEAFLEEARAVVERLERAIHVGRQASRGEIGGINIGYVGSAAFSGLLQQRVGEYRTASPDVVIKAYEMPMEKLPAMLAVGEIDIAFLRMPVVLPSSLSSQVLSRDKFCVAVPAQHPLALRGASVAPATLAKETFIVPEQPRGLQEVAHRGEFSPIVGATPGGLLAVLTHVSLGAGIAVIPDTLRSVITLPNVVYLDLAGAPIRSEVAAVYRKGERSPPVVNLLKYLKH